MRGAGRRRHLILAVFLYFTFIGGSFYSDLNFGLRVLNQVVVTALLGAWLAGRLRRGRPLPPTPLDGPILAWVAAHFLAAVFGLSPRFSLEKTWTVVVHALAFYLLVDLRRRGWTQEVARGLYLSAGVVCLVGLAEFACWYFGLPLLPQFVQGWPEIGGLERPFPPTLYRLNFTLNGATPLAAYLALLIPPALAIRLTARRKDDRQAILLWLVLAVVVEGLSFSRGGVLALLVSLPLTGLGWWYARPRQRGVLRRLWRTRRAAIVGGLLVALVLAALAGRVWLGRVVGRSHSVRFRLTLWSVAWRTFLEHPLTGVGPYNFGRGLLRRNDPALPRAQVFTAHNLYLNTAAELGLVGLVAGGWLIWAAGRAWLARYRRASSDGERLQVAAVGAALAGFAAQSLVDTFTATPHVLPVLALGAFALTGGAAEPGRRDAVAGVRRAGPALALALLALYAAGLAWADVAQFHFQRSVDLAGRGDLDGAVAEAELARRTDPAMPLYTFQKAYLLGQMADRPEAAVEAAALYRAGLGAEPVGGRQEANLAAVLWRAGDRTGAVEAMARAASTDPDPIHLVNLGFFYEETGDPDRAVAAYGMALSLAPELADSEFWQADPGRADLWPQVLARAEAALEGSAEVARFHLRLALARADWTAVARHARSVLQEEPRDCEALSALARARLEMGDIGEAGDLARQALSAGRPCGPAYLVRGQVRYAEGDPGAAEVDWRTALFLGQRRAAYHLGRLYEARGDGAMAARFYALALSPSPIQVNVEITLYDRRAVFDLLPPLFHIGVGPEEAQPWLELARLREEQGDLDAARRVYQVLLSEDPYLQAAQERLEALGEGR